MTTPITVLLSVYNGERWLHECIESVLGQTHSNFEFIIVNDGSKDTSLEVIKDFALRDQRIHVIDKPNTGLSDSLNVGIGQARGEWIARIDADDLCEPNRLAVQYAMACSNNKLVIIGSGLFLIDEDGQRKKTFCYPQGHQQLVGRLIDSKGFFSHSSAFIHTQTLRALGGYRNKFKRAEDYDLWLRLSEVGHLGCVHEPLVSIRQHADQISHDEGGLRQIVDARSALVCHLMRQRGLDDPVTADSTDSECAVFLQFVEHGVAQDKLVEIRRFVGELKVKRNMASFAGLCMLFVLAARSPHFVFLYLKDAYFGGKLALRLTNEWISRGSPCAE